MGRRIAQEQRRAAAQWVERLKQIQQLERERAQVERSIVDVSGDLAAAQRDLLVHRPSLSLEDIRRQGREEWLKLRAERLAKEQTPAATDKTADKSPALKRRIVQFKNLRWRVQREAVWW